MLYTRRMDETLRKGIYLNPGENRDFLMDVSLTKHDLFDPGDTVVVPGGREFRYAKSAGSNVISPNLGCNFTETGLISYTAFGVSHAVGTKEITIPAATHAALTKDQLAGGYVIVFNGSGNKDITYEITGNDACAADVAFNVTLDMGIGVAIVAATSAAEVYSNPWASLDQGNTSVLPRAGASVNYVAADEYYFWVQTKGIKFISPQSGVGNDNGGIVANWRHDGSLQKGETALAVTTATYDTIQPAGVVIAGSAAGNGPLVNLLGY